MVEYLQQVLDTFRVFLWIFLVVLSVIWFRALQVSADPLLVFSPDKAMVLEKYLKWVLAIIVVIILLLFFLPSSASLHALLT